MTDLENKKLNESEENETIEEVKENKVKNFVKKHGKKLAIAGGGAVLSVAGVVLGTKLAKRHSGDEIDDVYYEVEEVTETE